MRPSGLPAGIEADLPTGKLRVLFLAPQPFFIPRGTPISVLEALQALAGLGHRVDLLTLASGEDIEVPHVRMHRIPKLPFLREIPVGPSLRKVAADAVMVPVALRMLARNRYDLIHGVEDGAVIAWGLSAVSGVPFVYDMDSHLSPQIAHRGGLWRPIAALVSRLERRAMGASEGVLAVCPALAEIAGRHQDPARVTLLPDMPLFDGDTVVPSAEVERLGGVRIVYVGNLEPYQGIDLLLSAFREIAGTHPDAQLVIVGGSTSHIAEYRERAGPLVDENRIHFLGPRPLSQLGPLLAAADILVSPRLHGVNTPMKIYSYLESGRPLVATRLLTHTQVLDESVSELADPTPKDFARALARLLEDPERRAALGAQGQSFVRREFGRERFVQRLGAFYADLADRMGSDRRAPSSRNRRPTA